MKRDTFERLKKMGITFDDDFENLLVNPLEKQQNKIEEKKGLLSIKYQSSTADGQNIYLTFEISQSQLKVFEAKIFVQEMNATNEIAVNKSITLKNAKTQKVTVSFLKTMVFDQYFWQSALSFQATITVDNLSAKTNEFKLKFVKGKQDKIKTCYCNRDFTLDEMQAIVEGIRDNTFYSVDGKDYPISNLRKKLFNRNNDPSQKYDTELVAEKDQTYKKLTEVLNNSFKKYKINNCIQKIHFLAQMYTETEYFTKTIEGTIADLPSVDPWRGRGFLHLTHDYNYKAYDESDKRLKNIKNEDFKVLDNYSLVATNLALSADTAGWFWSVGGQLYYKKGFEEVYKKTPNEISLYGDKYIDGVSRTINGGTNAINERKTYYLTFKNILEYEKCSNKK